ncbi:hypothetical protein PVL29_006402 [Vitis rotundifolia]|uniref:Uncharacterized protein n=1 Tax=Vitis rotundifolia TaxID=103349 RepID=A0AA39DY03_VITRO|nr:hypothetical protein PVL29_006402 [Vitis rotundifolia]
MNPGGYSISLTYIASERIILGYGRGKSSIKAALESDTRVLAFEAGRKQKIRVNMISAGLLRSHAAKAIGFIDTMIEYSLAMVTASGMCDILCVHYCAITPFHDNALVLVAMYKRPLFSLISIP